MLIFIYLSFICLYTDLIVFNKALILSDFCFINISYLHVKFLINLCSREMKWLLCDCNFAVLHQTTSNVSRYELTFITTLHIILVWL